MKTIFMSLIVALGMGAPALAHGPVDNRLAGASGQPVIVVSCFRGPLEQIIWDHPRAVFVDSLVNIGYSFAQATAIAERVCRDRQLVGNRERLLETTRAIIASAPRQ